jgi:DNA-binding transcriptional regulator YiaG
LSQRWVWRKKSLKHTRKTRTRRKNSLSGSTPASTAIDLHYGRINLVKRWKRDRIERLCGYLKLSQNELASLMAVPHATFQKYTVAGRFPPPVCLLLTIMEGKYLNGIAPDVIPNVFDFNG